MSDLVRSAFSPQLRRDTAASMATERKQYDAVPADDMNAYAGGGIRGMSSSDLTLSEPSQAGGGMTSPRAVSSSTVSASSSGSQQCQLEFALSLLLCNAVLPDVRPLSEGDGERVVFQSQSPDEIALLEALDQCGVTLIGRSGDQLTVRVALPGYRVYTAQYTLLATLEFSSTWRRMSVVVRAPDHSVHLFVKGADTTIAALIDKADAQQQRLLETTMQQVTDFALTGSRTLVMAGRVLSEDEWLAWFEQYHAAETALEDRENEIERAFRSIEQSLQLLGASAVDDQLQELVPQTIDFLLAASIKVVVLTGDKLETAVTIAKHAHLISPEGRLLYVAGVEQAEVSSSLGQAKAAMDAELEQSRSAHSMVPLPADGRVRFALAIDGVSLELALLHCQSLFIAIFQQCDTIVSYRSTPLQKALVVKMCKTQLGLTTLAIGDGANDCLDPNTLVALADGGTILASDVKLHDRLLGTGGRTAVVTGAPFSRPEARMYRVTAATGDSFVCSPGHLVTLAWRRRTSMAVTELGQYKTVICTMWRSDTLQRVRQRFRFLLRDEANCGNHHVVYASYEEALAAYRTWTASNNPHDGCVKLSLNEASGRISAIVYEGASSSSARRLISAHFSWVIPGRAWAPPPIIVDSVQDAVEHAWAWYNRAFPVVANDQLSVSVATLIECDSAAEEESSAPTLTNEEDEESNWELTTTQQQHLPDSLPHAHKHWSVERNWRPLAHGELVEVRAEQLAKPNAILQQQRLGLTATKTARAQLVIRSMSLTAPSTAVVDSFSNVLSIVPEPSVTSCVGWQVDGDGRFVLGNGVLTHNCSMIIEAHVGVGVLGKEGAHAAMSSDFVIHRFHHLVRLLCLHGRWSYWRTTQVVFFSIYKNFVFPLPLFWYQWWTLGSGTTMYDALLVTLFNTFFTSIPPLVVGISDKDVRDELLLSNPQAYAAFKREDPLTVFGFVYMMCSGVYHSAVLYFLAFGIYNINDVISHNGRVANMVTTSTHTHTHTHTHTQTIRRDTQSVKLSALVQSRCLSAHRAMLLIAVCSM